MPRRPSLDRWHAPLVLVVSVAVVMLCWIVGNPRSSGPDESSHMVTAAGIVRGDLDGDPNPADPATHVFELPAMVGAPDPGCWASTFDPNVPVACQNAVPIVRDERQLVSTSFNYPPWALILPGLASYAPTARGYAYLARMASAAIPFVLVAGSLLALSRARTTAAAAALLGLTPIVWFTFGVVNPSAVAIAGGLALWTGLLSDRSRLSDNLALAGWAAVLLARRDGPVWATLIVLSVCWLTAMTPRQMLDRFPRPHRIAAIALTAIPVLTPLANGFYDFNLALAFAPAALVAAELLAERWRAAPRRGSRVALAAGTAAVVVVGVVLALVQRPGGFNSLAARLVVANTGEHMRQLVGVLGWLSTPVPSLAVFVFWAVVGGLVFVAALEHRRAALTFVGALTAAIVVAWVLELGQGANYGRYWHGRYTMPLAVGLPLVLTWRPTGGGAWLVDRTRTTLAVTSWTIANVAFVAAQQRWAVGIGGSWRPWNWDTWGAPVAPWFLVLVHAVATAALAMWCLGSPTARTPDRADRAEVAP